MVKTEFRQALKVAKSELENCLRQQQAIEKRVLELRQVITSLSNALNDGERPQIKPGGLAAAVREGRLTEEVRTIFRAKSGQVLSAQDIVDDLEKLGHNMDKYQNQLATVGVMLGRLREKEEIVSAKDTTGKRGFMARNPLPAFYGR